VGNDDNSATRGVTGGTLPAMIWKSAMRAAEKGLPLKPLERSPPQEANDQGFFDKLFSSNDGVHQTPTDDEAGAMADLRSRPMPDLPPAQPRGHGGGILGWLFGNDDDPPPPPPSAADGLRDDGHP
jgi:penicillin-binding protein 1A